MWCCSSFHNQSRIFNNEHNSYPKMSVKRPIAYSSAVFVTSVINVNLCIVVPFDIYLVYIPNNLKPQQHETFSCSHNPSLYWVITRTETI
jgi:hypothetical protein